MSLGERWLAAAYRGDAWLAALGPLEALYRRGVARRAAAYAAGRRPVWRAPVPVIVVGNITLGGTGKSPLEWATNGPHHDTAEALRAAGAQPTAHLAP